MYMKITKNTSNIMHLICLKFQILFQNTGNLFCQILTRATLNCLSFLLNCVYRWSIQRHHNAFSRHREEKKNSMVCFSVGSRLINCQGNVRWKASTFPKVFLGTSLFEALYNGVCSFDYFGELVPINGKIVLVIEILYIFEI